MLDLLLETFWFIFFFISHILFSTFCLSCQWNCLHPWHWNLLSSSSYHLLFFFQFYLLPSCFDLCIFMSLSLLYFPVYFNHLISLSRSIPSPSLSHSTASPWAPSSSLVHPSYYCFCSVIHLFLPFTTQHLPLSFLAPLLSDSQSCLVLSAVQYFITMAQSQHDNGHNTQPNSGFKETYRDIMRWLPHWRFTTAKSTGLNTPKIQHMAAFPLVWICVCEMLLNVYVGDGKCVGLCMHLNAWAWVFV